LLEPTIQLEDKLEHFTKT
jgi:hypothetical protein